jgi:transposase
MAYKEQRIAVVELYKQGRKPKFIIDTLGVNRRFVNRAIKRFKEQGSSDDRPRSGRPRSADTPTNRRKIRMRVKRNPERSMRKMGKELKIGKSSVSFDIFSCFLNKFSF